MSPELEEARALGELVQAGLAAEADDRLRRVGRRGAGAARLDRVGRARTTTSCGSKAVVYINTDGNGRGFLERRRLAHARAVHQRRRADVEDPETKRQRLEAAAGARDRRGIAPERADEARSRAGPAHRRARLGLRLHAVPAAPRRRRRSTSASAARTSDGIYHSIYDDFYSLHALPRHRLRLRPRARADGRARR